MTLAIDKITAEGSMMTLRGDDPKEIEAYVNTEFKKLSGFEQRILATEALLDMAVAALENELSERLAADTTGMSEEELAKNNRLIANIRASLATDPRSAA